MAPTCGMCNSATAQQCKQCHSIAYCSTQFQKNDWPSHKVPCSQYSSANDQPSPLHRRAILFPDSEKQPEFIWIECKETAEGCYRWEEPQNIDDYMGPERTMAERTSFDRNMICGRLVENSIEIWNGDAFSIDGSIPNQSIIAATRGAVAHERCGSVVVLRKNSRRITYAGSFGDRSMEYYVHIVDHFKMYC